MISISDKEPGHHQLNAAADRNVCLTITGVDVNGHMFRHPATVITLDGRDFTFWSKSQPELNGSVLVELDYSKAGVKRCTTQGYVNSNQFDEAKGLHRVTAKLEVG